MSFSWYIKIVSLHLNLKPESAGCPRFKDIHFFLQVQQNHIVTLHLDLEHERCPRFKDMHFLQNQIVTFEPGT